MKVYITTAYLEESPQLKAMRKFAQLDKYKEHFLVENPEESDLILFVEAQQLDDDPFYEKIKAHPLVKRYRTKTLMYTDQDKPHYVIPGLYVQPDKRYWISDKQKPTMFLLEMNEYIDEKEIIDSEPDVLYSFMGMRSSFVRQKLLSRDHPNGIIVDTTGFSLFSPHLSTPETVQKRKEEYSDLLGRSKFILCPRGHGLSSYRLFETMRVKRVPVIISDNWVSPDGPRWEDFAVFVSEKDVLHIAEIIKEEEEATWEERSQLARDAWETFFAPDVYFNYMIEQCRKLLDVSNGDEDFFKPQLTIQEIYLRIRLSQLGKIVPMIKPLIIKLYKLR